MLLLDYETGALCFEDDFVISEDCDFPASPDIADLGIHKACGLTWRVLTVWDGEAPRRVWLIPVENPKLHETSAEIRGRMLDAFGLSEPKDCAMRSFEVRFPFGVLTVCTEQYTGRSEALLCYQGNTEAAFHE